MDEGNLHRALASKIVSSYSRTPSARPVFVDVIVLASIVRQSNARKKGGNVDRLKVLCGMIFKDTAHALLIKIQIF